MGEDEIEWNRFVGGVAYLWIMKNKLILEVWRSRCNRTVERIHILKWIWIVVEVTSTALLQYCRSAEVLQCSCSVEEYLIELLPEVEDGRELEGPDLLVELLCGPRVRALKLLQLDQSGLRGLCLPAAVDVLGQREERRTVELGHPSYRLYVVRVVRRVRDRQRAQRPLCRPTSPCSHITSSDSILLCFMFTS